MELLTVHKDLLRPGTYTLPNRVEWTCTPGDVRNAAVVGNRMLQTHDALAPPLIWEHDWNAAAMPLTVLLSALSGQERREWAAGYARNIFGHAARYYLRDEGGQPVLWSENRIKPAAADSFQAARYVSPRMDHNYRAGDGSYWPGSTVQHIAATPRPIQLSQLPVMLSGVVGPGRSARSVFANRRYLLGALPMADENDDKGGEGGGSIKRLLTALGNAGINIPDGINSVDELSIALETYAANNGGAGAGDPLDDLDDQPAADAMSGAGGAMLSAIAVKGRADVLAELRRLEPHLVKNMVLTVAQVRTIEAGLKAATEPVLLSAMAGKKPAGVVAQFEAAKDALRAKIKAGRRVGGGINLSDIVEAPAPDLAPRVGATPEQIEAERARVRKEYSKASDQTPKK